MRRRTFSTTTVADLGKDYDSFGSQSYTDFFPGLNLRWNATPSLVLRAAVTRAIGRANYEQLAPTTVVNTSDNEVSMGNPNLKPLTSTNYDLAGEYYIGRKGIVSIAGFYKTIQNPIYSATTEQSGTFAGQALVDAQVTMPVNADSAFVKGRDQRPDRAQLPARAARRLQHRRQHHLREIAREGYPGPR